MGASPVPPYYVRANDTKGLGRSIDTHNLQYFELDGAKEFCQQIVAGEIDLEAMRAKIDAERDAKEQAAVRAATERAKRFRDRLEAAGISFNTMLDLQAAYDADMDSLARNILLGYERGEGFPNE